VVPVAPWEVDAVLEAREVIEEYAAGKLMRRPALQRGQVVERLRALLGEQQKALDAGDDRAFVDTDRAFHHHVVAEAGNPILLDLYESLRDRQLRMGLGALVRTPGRARQILDQHAQLVSLIEVADADGFRRHLLEHLHGTRAATLGSATDS
jgi:DNA-binding GntR family transcriptional regulator